MKKYNCEVICFLSLTLLFNGCWGLRSAEGLSEGEININYVAPIGGSIRYGVIDNLETRFTVAGEVQAYDILLHSNIKENAINYGVFFGVQSLDNKHAEYYHSGVILSKRINQYFTPYVSLQLLFQNSIQRVNYENSYYSIGADIEIPLFNKVSLLLTPEIGQQMKYMPGGDFDRKGWSATGNVGFIVKLY